MKIFKNKLVIGILCILVGLAVGFLALPKVAERQNEEITIVKAKTFIQQGTEITSDMLDTVTVTADVIQNGIEQTEKIKGRYAVTDIYEDDFFTQDKISDMVTSENLLQLASAKGKQVVSITLPSLASSVSGRLQSGDVVTIMTTSKNTNLDMALEPDAEYESSENNTYIISELKYLEVCTLTTVNAADARVESHPVDGEQNELPVTISFFVSEKQALKLAEIEQNTQIHIAFVARGIITSQYIADEDRVLNTDFSIDTEAK